MSKKNSRLATTHTTNSTNSATQTNGTKIRNLGPTLTPNKYTATFVRDGVGGKRKNVLLIMVRDEANHMLCDHVWVKYCNAFERLKPGDVISFTATPYRYIKGYSGNRHVHSDFAIDVSLGEFRQVRVIGHNPKVKTKLVK